ncbi:uncharacterized protein EMH_0065900 [Eimeria mitis]|uniref:Transmembrane protein n=1 Tax=Eimeria mitis TaxID=44415 RepID=U6KEZ5_9EIME|nr:uncharacterized protein EMH_0065900 [Eimeria mitis]CDJ36605.1 hypothetical protein, conserved [Eimeria mitis]
MRGNILALLAFSVLFISSAAADDAVLAPAKEPEVEEVSQLSSTNVDALNSEAHDEGPPRRIEASLELRRLYAEKPKSVPRPKGFPALLASMGLLGHAGVQAAKDWGTMPLPRATVSLLLGKARFDTTNFALYSLLAGCLLFYLGVARRWKSHKERDLWRLDEMLRQDRARVEAIRRGAIGKR